MKTRAIATRSPRSNAVGTVEFEITEWGLNLHYLSVGAYQDGYTPAALTEGTELHVPWPSIVSARVEGDQLFLEIDRSLTPHNRLLLEAFSDGDHTHYRELQRQRWLVRIFLVAASLFLVFWGLSTLPHTAPDRGLLLGAATTIVAAILVLGVGLGLDRRISDRNTKSDLMREQFVRAIAQHVPGLMRLPHRVVPPAKKLRNKLPELLPRSTTAVVILMTASGLALLLTSSWLVPSRTPSLTTKEQALRAEPAAAHRAPVESQESAKATETTGTQGAWVPASAETAPTLAPVGTQTSPASSAPSKNACECLRSDSVLWQTPPSLLSPVLIQQRTRAHKGHTHLELELGVVNNGNEPIRELTLTVRFFEQEAPPSKKRRHTKDRPLYFEGPLYPGRAIKWHVEARATHFTVENPHPEPLAPNGDNAASADAFAELLDANHRPIRLHGAMMLAFLGDARAKKGAADLKEALREEEAPYLDRVLQSVSDIQTCQVTASEKGAIRVVQACLYNQSSAPRKDLGVRLRALSHEFDHRTPVAVPPIIIAEDVQALPFELAAESGRRVELEMNVANPDNLVPATFELFADRHDLLH